MDHISRVFKVLPVVVGEDLTPGTATSDDRLEAAHLLHAVELIIFEAYSRVLEVQSPPNGSQIGRPKLREHGRPMVMSFHEVIAVAEARIARSERVRSEVISLRDHVQMGNFLPIESEEASAEVAGRVNDAIAVAGPELGLLLVGNSCQKVAIAGAELDAGGEGLKNTSIWPSGG